MSRDDKPSRTPRNHIRSPTAVRGRPATLSSEQIVQAALAMLEADPRQELSMASIARELGVSAPALGRYFPTRQLLLLAMSASVFADFPDMPANAPWREQLLEWQRALAHLFSHHRGLMKLMVWDDQLSGPWLRVQAPVLVLLRSIGFEGAALVETASWFLAGSTGLLRTYLPDESADHRRAYLLNTEVGLSYLSSEQRKVIEENESAFSSVDSDAAIAAGMSALVEGVARQLDAFLPDHGAAVTHRQIRIEPVVLDELKFDIEVNVRVEDVATAQKVVVSLRGRLESGDD